MINQPLFDDQFFQVLGFLFNGKKATILRWLRQTGRSRVTWIYFSLNGSLRASFVSFKDLTLAYLRWLNTVKILKLKREERKAIGRANYLLFNVGDLVFKIVGNINRAGVITEMSLSERRLPQIFVDWGNSLPVPEQPELLETF